MKLSFDQMKAYSAVGFGTKHVGGGEYELIPQTRHLPAYVPCPGGVVRSSMWKCIAWDCDKCALKP